MAADSRVQQTSECPSPVAGEGRLLAGCRPTRSTGADQSARSRGPLSATLVDHGARVWWTSDCSPRRAVM